MKNKKYIELNIFDWIVAVIIFVPVLIWKLFTDKLNKLSIKRKRRYLI